MSTFIITIILAFGEAPDNGIFVKYDNGIRYIVEKTDKKTVIRR